MTTTPALRRPYAKPRIRSLPLTAHPTGCWTFEGFKRTPDGYLRLRIGRLRVMAHRLMVFLATGSLPPFAGNYGKTVDHLCRNRACVNPAHLELVSGIENIARGESFSARYSRQTHCLRGHPLVPGNLKARADTHRQCLTCVRINGRLAAQRDRLDPEKRERRNRMERERRRARRTCLAGNWPAR